MDVGTRIARMARIYREWMRGGNGLHEYCVDVDVGVREGGTRIARMVRICREWIRGGKG